MLEKKGGRCCYEGSSGSKSGGKGTVPTVTLAGSCSARKHDLQRTNRAILHAAFVSFRTVVD